MEQKTEDLRTDQEKRQDAFEIFLKQAEDSSMARINFYGDKISVRYSGKSGNIVYLNYLGRRTDIPSTLAFNLDMLDETELLRVIK